jgi:type II secretory pathway component PulF
MIHGFAWGLFLALLTGGVPRIETIFADFGVPLPHATIMVIRASHMGIVLASSILAILGVDWFVLRLFSKQGDVERSQSWSTLMIATPLVMSIVTVVTLGLPFLTIMTHLSG